jgi:UDP-N-acetylglucosamine--N-acetylmuramyl-(pentapeptide) pyrophosphoryl-undecaprenol N-acetylglucosamine transferase
LRYKARSGGLKILILGGSLGAKSFNQLLPEALARANNIQSITHQVGRGSIKEVEENYKNFNISKVKVIDFIGNMAESYAEADLVICRAGALTISEICVSGVAAILIPYPYAVDDHQKHNAFYLTHHAAAFMVEENEHLVEHITTILSTLTREKCLTMALRANALAFPEACKDISNIIKEVYKDER